jgi:hypothetical protein
MRHVLKAPEPAALGLPHATCQKTPIGTPGELLMSVDELESAMRTQTQVVIEPVHRFADGLYAREITIPAGTLLTGKIHRTRHLNVISSGEITVWSDGEPVRRIQAPFSFVSEPGARRVGYAHRDTTWTTIHGTSETDLDVLEATLIESREPSSLLPSAGPTEENSWLG